MNYCRCFLCILGGSFLLRVGVCDHHRNAYRGRADAHSISCHLNLKNMTDCNETTAVCTVRTRYWDPKISRMSTFLDLCKNICQFSLNVDRFTCLCVFAGQTTLQQQLLGEIKGGQRLGTIAHVTFGVPSQILIELGRDSCHFHTRIVAARDGNEANLSFSDFGVVHPATQRHTALVEATHEIYLLVDGLCTVGHGSFQGQFSSQNLHFLFGIVVPHVAGSFENDLDEIIDLTKFMIGVAIVDHTLGK
mmetsp:Transcript_5693/g.11867  ORF Transcript_5693/g.11867 Transcript_5693/m.11867 type:complete len:248 (+) Transcript_5693:706-1449(+)